MAPKPFNSDLRSSLGIACYGTAFLASAPIDAAALERGIAPDVPQFSTPRLDASFLANCGSLLNGKTATIDDPRTYFKRLAGTDFRLSKSTIFYECSTELSGLLVAMSAERAAEIVRQWHSINWPAKTKLGEPNGRTQRRLEILNNLAAIAKQARKSDKTIRLRVEYRKQR